MTKTETFLFFIPVYLISAYCLASYNPYNQAQKRGVQAQQMYKNYQQFRDSPRGYPQEQVRKFYQQGRPFQQQGGRPPTEQRFQQTYARRGPAPTPPPRDLQGRGFQQVSSPQSRRPPPPPYRQNRGQNVAALPSPSNHGMPSLEDLTRGATHPSGLNLDLVHKRVTIARQKSIKGDITEDVKLYAVGNEVVQKKEAEIAQIMSDIIRKTRVIQRTRSQSLKQNLGKIRQLGIDIGFQKSVLNVQRNKIADKLGLSYKQIDQIPHPREWAPAVIR